MKKYRRTRLAEILICMAGLIFVTMRLSAQADSSRRFDSPDKRKAYASLMLRKFCTDIGPHPFGTRAFERVAIAIHQEMAAAIPGAFLDRYLDRWEILGLKPTLLFKGKGIDVAAAENCAGTPMEGVTGIIKKIAVKGVPLYAIADVKTEKTAAYISISKDVDPVPEYLVDGDVLSIPRFIVGQKDVPLIELLAKDRAQVQARMAVLSAPEVPTYNVVGSIAGKSAREILVLGHADSVIQTEGANDNMATVIVMLLLANAFSGSTPDCTLTFVATGSEEGAGYNGARHYAKRREAEGTARNIRFVLNCDSFTYGPNVWTMTSDSVLITLVKEVHDFLNLKTRPRYSPNADPWAMDASPFRSIDGARAVHFNSRGYDTLAANHIRRTTPPTFPSIASNPPTYS